MMAHTSSNVLVQCPSVGWGGRLVESLAMPMCVPWMGKEEGKQGEPLRGIIALSHTNSLLLNLKKYH